MKIISKTFVNQSVLEKELAVLDLIKNNMNSDGIVKIFDIYQDSVLVHIVMEYMGGGDLYHRLLQKKRFSGNFSSSSLSS